MGQLQPKTYTMALTAEEIESRLLRIGDLLSKDAIRQTLTNPAPDTVPSTQCMVDALDILKEEISGELEGFTPIQLREALRRTYAEAGLNLVEGSFETGGTLNNARDVILRELSGRAFGWNGSFPKVVEPGDDGTGFIDKSRVTENKEPGTDPLMRVGGPRDVEITNMLSTVGGGTIVADIPPEFPVQGTTWVRCSDLKSFVWYEDSDSGQWVEEKPSVGGPVTPETVHVSETPPDFPIQGMRWVRCSDLKSFVWYEDSDSGQWVEEKPSVGGPVTPETAHVSETPPDFPIQGMRWVRCSDIKSFVWFEDSDSGQWVEENPSMGTPLQEAGPVPREALRRTYAEAGMNLVAGSFEAGGTLTSASDVLLHEASGKAYGWPGEFPKLVTAGASLVGYVDQSNSVGGGGGGTPASWGPEAPMDGTLYARKSGSWEAITQDGGGSVGESNKIESPLSFAGDDKEQVNRFSCKLIEFSHPDVTSGWHQYTGGAVGADGLLYFFGTGNQPGHGVLKFNPYSYECDWMSNSTTSHTCESSCMISKGRMLMVSDTNGYSGGYSLVLIQHTPVSHPKHFETSATALKIIPAHSYSSSDALFGGAVYHPSGKVYLVPRNFENIVEIDPDEDTDPVLHPLEIIESDGASDRWWGGVVGPDGMVYFTPNQSRDLLEFNTESGAITRHPFNMYGEFRGAVLLLDGRILLIPVEGGTGLTFDVNEKTFSSSQVTWMEDTAYGGVLAPNGKVYLAPHNTFNRLTEYDPSTERFMTQLFKRNTDSIDGTTTPIHLGCRGGVLAPNGKIYMPARDGILEVTPSGWLGYRHMDFSELMSVYTSKF